MSYLHKHLCTFHILKKVEKVGIMAVWPKYWIHIKQCHLEAKLLSNPEHLLRAVWLCPNNSRPCWMWSESFTSLQSRFHFDLPQHPPVKRRKQTGLSESRRTRAKTCFVEGRREKGGKVPAHSNQTLKLPGPSGFCVLCAGACWGRTWCGRPDRRGRSWTSSQGPSLLWIPPGTPRALQSLRYSLKRASQDLACRTYVEI